MTRHAWEDTSRSWVPRYGSEVGRIPALYSPEVLWHHDQGLTDSSGNGHPLTVATGAARYTTAAPGLAGVQLYQSKLECADAALQIAGDITIVCVCKLQRIIGTGTYTILGWGHTSTETEAFNNLYLVRRASTGLVWTSESGSGVDATFTTTNVPPFRRWGPLVARRASNVVTLRWGGALLGTSGTLTAPTGGGSARFSLGGVYGDVSTLTDMSTIGTAIWAGALSDGEITALEQAIMGGA